MSQPHTSNRSQPQRWIGLWLLLGLLATPCLGHAQSLRQLESSELRGCFALSANGKRMACIDVDHGMAGLEVKDISTRRLYKVFPLGSAETPSDVNTTPKKVLKRALKWLDKKKFRPIRSATRAADGSFPVPHTGCALVLPEGTPGFVRTITEAGVNPWLITGGIGGAESLVAVSADPDTDQIFLVLAFTTSSGDATIRDFQVVKLSQLTSRKGCEAPAPPSDEPAPESEK